MLGPHFPFASVCLPLAPWTPLSILGVMYTLPLASWTPLSILEVTYNLQFTSWTPLSILEVKRPQPLASWTPLSILGAMLNDNSHPPRSPGGQFCQLPLAPWTPLSILGVMCTLPLASWTPLSILEVMYTLPLAPWTPLSILEVMYTLPLASWTPLSILEVMYTLPLTSWTPLSILEVMYTLQFSSWTPLSILEVMSTQLMASWTPVRVPGNISYHYRTFFDLLFISWFLLVLSREMYIWPTTLWTFTSKIPKKNNNNNDMSHILHHIPSYSCLFFYQVGMLGLKRTLNDKNEPTAKRSSIAPDTTEASSDHKSMEEPVEEDDIDLGAMDLNYLAFMGDNDDDESKLEDQKKNAATPPIGTTWFKFNFEISSRIINIVCETNYFWLGMFTIHSIYLSNSKIEITIITLSIGFINRFTVQDRYDTSDIDSVNHPNRYDLSETLRWVRTPSVRGDYPHWGTTLTLVYTTQDDRSHFRNPFYLSVSTTITATHTGPSEVQSTV
jgi:hypothetical protein